MDIKRLNKEANNHAKVMGDVPENNSIHAFKSGAKWLMGQPLAERMTEVEKAKARAAYDRAEEGYNSKDDIEYAVGYVVKTVLEGIFGADLFR